jgi:hypothetical protein
LGAADGGVGPALHRAMSHYVRTARRAVAALRPGGSRHGTGDGAEAGGHVHFDGPTEALAWLETERANMIEVARQAHSAERDLAGWVPLLTAALCPYLALHQQWDHLGELGELSRSVATRLEDRHAGALASRCLAVAGRHPGRGAGATRGAQG